MHTSFGVRVLRTVSRKWSVKPPANQKGFFICIPMDNKSNRDHSFDIELATIFGSVEKAILIKNFSFWCEENERRKIAGYFKDESWWTEESYTSLAKKYPYMKRPSLIRWVKELESGGWIIANRYSRDVNFYRMGETFKAWNVGGDWQAIEDTFLRVVQNEPHSDVVQNGLSGSPKWTMDVVQNGLSVKSKMDYINIDNIEVNNIDNNIESADAFFATIIDGQTLEVGKPQKVAPAPAAPPAARAKKGKSGKESYDYRDIARHLEMKEQVFFTEILNARLWQKWIEYKKGEHRQTYKLDTTAAQCVKDFYEKSNGNTTTLEKMINTSIAAKWQGVFPVKQNAATQITNQKQQPTFEEMLGL